MAEEKKKDAPAATLGAEERAKAKTTKVSVIGTRMVVIGNQVYSRGEILELEPGEAKKVIDSGLAEEVVERKKGG
jgi:hypothetical protein